MSTDFLKKNFFALISVIIALVAITISLGFNAKILEARFQTTIKEEVKKAINRESDILTQSNRTFMKQELSKVEIKIAEIEKGVSDLKLVLTDSDNKTIDLTSRMADLQTKLDALEQKLNKKQSAVKAASPSKKKGK